MLTQVANKKGGSGRPLQLRASSRAREDIWMAMGDAKPLVLIPMPSCDRDLLVPTAAVATYASPSARSVADSDDDESKPSSASAAAQTGREVAALPSPLPPTPASLRMTVASRVRFGLPEKCQCANYCGI
jgi:hypothetical protein